MRDISIDALGLIAFLLNGLFYMASGNLLSAAVAAMTIASTSMHLYSWLMLRDIQLDIRRFDYLAKEWERNPTIVNHNALDAYITRMQRRWHLKERNDDGSLRSSRR